VRHNLHELSDEKLEDLAKNVSSDNRRGDSLELTIRRATGPEYQDFSLQDTFNPDNTITGKLCRISDHRYGALYIHEVNGKRAPQVIYCTPKLQYPFDKQGKFTLPDSISHIYSYEKLDGTNICAFRYTDYTGKRFTSFKTRLTPVLQNNSFNQFRDLWEEAMERNEWIREVLDVMVEYNLSFELYGSRNPITVKYEEDLAVKLLFLVECSTGRVIPPHSHALSGNAPKWVKLDELNKTTYQKLQKEATAVNSGDLLTEGWVLYVGRVGQGWLQLKCKPEEIEKIHWAAGGIPNSSLWATAINGFESEGDLSMDGFRRLLAEEYTSQQIGKAEVKLKKTLSQAREHILLTAQANEAWKKAREAGFDLKADKAATLRFVSQFFDRKMMSKVGGLLLLQAVLLKTNKRDFK